MCGWEKVHHKTISQFSCDWVDFFLLLLGIDLCGTEKPNCKRLQYKARQCNATTKVSGRKKMHAGSWISEVYWKFCKYSPSKIESQQRSFHIFRSCVWQFSDFSSRCDFILYICTFIQVSFEIHCTVIDGNVSENHIIKTCNPNLKATSYFLFV